MSILVSQLPMIIGEKNITVVINNKPYNINSDHLNFTKIKAKLKDKFATSEDLLNLVDIPVSINKFSNGLVTITDDMRVLYNGEELHNSLTTRMITMFSEGFNILPLVEFLKNLMKNPSRVSVNELYEFLEKNDLPITTDGCFLAYKTVRNDYKDWHTNKMDNSVGKVVSVPRNSVDDDRNNTCSYGLHFCSLGYLSHFHAGEGRVVLVKINPADVVSFPRDYNNSKGRTSSYTVVADHKMDYKTSAFNKSVYNDYDDCTKSCDLSCNEDSEEWDEYNSCHSSKTTPVVNKPLRDKLTGRFIKKT